MTTIDNLVAEATEQQNRIFAAAGIMTVSQTYKAAVADLELTPYPAPMGETVATLKDLAWMPVHGKREWMLDQAWSALIWLLEPYLFADEDEEETGSPVARKNPGDRQSFPLILAKFEADFEDNLRVAEQCSL